MLSIHRELLSADQLKIFKKLVVFKTKVTLAGGTALSLQLGHRFSFDFDLFQEKPVTSADIRLLAKTVKIKKIIFKTSDMVLTQIESNISLSLVHYWFKPVYAKVDAGPLYLFDYHDIAFDKAETIGRRATWRDYFDLFYLLKNEFCTIDEIIIGAKKKFGIEFIPEQFLTQLSYFDDLTQFNLKFVKKTYSQKEIKDLLTEKVADFTKKELKIS